MPVTIEPGFHPAQQQVATSPARFRVVAAGRRWGKTREGVSECVRVALAGGRAWWVAPTYSLGLEAWRPLNQIGQQIPGVEIRVSEKELLFPGGGLIQLRSADSPQRLSGAGLDLLVVDEAAFCVEETWSQALRPALSDRKGRALFLSTPKGIGNWFHTLWSDAAGKDDWEAFQFPTTSNPFIDPAEVEAARGDLGSLVWAQEYGGQFVESGGTLFRTDWARYAEEETRDGVSWWVCGDRAIDTREAARFCTVDLAASTKASADYTVIASCATHKGVIVVLDIVRRRMEGPDIIPAIRAQISRWNLGVAHIESAGFQLTLIQQARRDGLAVRELKADRDKYARALPLAARMEAGDVWFTRGVWLKDLELELFSFPAVGHDDQVDALAYAAVVAGQGANVDGWLMA